jgi:uncharacterized cupin superfamily protein
VFYILEGQTTVVDEAGNGVTAIAGEALYIPAERATKLKTAAKCRPGTSR